ncbi:MAG: 3-oxoacyl-[acyl-carrier-protein] reductase [Ignavibacteria bacterium]|nr:3-oxoacyl-[acyl-carrier-protein] reductase [Ignavibacteria bacterium]MCC7158166.1 3-oxoacyl-[acyl-carrier-protein] reductase [Ignavibacteria bacterium]
MLLNKNAIITGGARGIGRAIAEDFINEGAYIVILDKFFPDDFENWVQSKSSGGRKIFSRTLDVTNTSETEQVCSELAKELGKIDILVNNAGITRDKLIMRMAEEDWDSVLAVNLKGAFNMMKALSMIMAKQRAGKIINISSVVGLMGNAGQSNYSASKAGLIGLSKSVAKEFASRNINVNCVAPGFVETDMTAKLNVEQRTAMLSVVPLKRTSQPSEIAGVVSFLASDKANYITGQVIAVDGGMVM